MTQFYAPLADLERCRECAHLRTPTTITGLDSNGELRAFSGTIQSVETGHLVFVGYPLRVTMPDAQIKPPSVKLGQ